MKHILIKADPLRIEDSGRVWDIHNENSESTRDQKKVGFYDHTQWWKTIFDKEDIYLILSNNSHRIGYIRVNKETHEISIALKKVYQNQSIGTKALQELVSNGYKHLIAEVNIQNNQSNRFFIKNGFKHTETYYLSKYNEIFRRYEYGKSKSETTQIQN